MSPWRAAAALFLVAAVLASGWSLRRGHDDRPDPPSQHPRATVTTSATVLGETEDSDVPASTPLEDQTFTTELASPPAPFEVTLAGALHGSMSGQANTGCLRGSGYFDVLVRVEVPLQDERIGIVGMAFGAPGYTGPGSYDLSQDQAAEWSLAVVDVDTDEPTEFFAPESGARGIVTIDADDRSGSFDLRGLVDRDGRAASATGRFTCSTVDGG